GQPGLSGREIAQRLGITASAVSQRLARIQARFRALEDMRLFGD
ncbi:MAG: winged helix-turn-helix transcriptional regulator, partial [Desulfurellales bacterium]